MGMESSIEGYSFCWIKWASGLTLFPWHMADWIKEIHALANEGQLTSNLILCNENFTDDRLAQEWPSCVFVCCLHHVLFSHSVYFKLLISF